MTVDMASRGYIVVCLGVAGLGYGCLGASALEQAWQLEQQRKYDEAIAQYLKAFETEGQAYSAHLGLASVYTATGRYEEALKAVAQAVQIADTPDAAVAKANVLFAQGDYEQAAGVMETVVQQVPDSPEQRHRLGLARFHAGDREGALEAFSAAVQLRPDFIPSHVFRAKCLVALNRLDEAAHVLKTTADRESQGSDNHVALQMALGEVYDAMGTHDYAQQIYRSLLTSRPDDPYISIGLARALRNTGKLSSATSLLMATARKHPKLPHAHFELGLAFRDAKKEGRAVAELSTAMRLDPRYRDPYKPLIQLLEKRGNKTALFEVLRNASRALERDGDIHVRFGDAALANGDNKQAIEAYSRAVKLDGNNIQALYGLGLSQYRSGNVEAAHETYETLVHLAPGKAAELNQAYAHAAMKLIQASEDKKPVPRKQRRRGDKKRRR